MRVSKQQRMLPEWTLHPLLFDTRGAQLQLLQVLNAVHAVVLLTVDWNIEDAFPCLALALHAPGQADGVCLVIHCQSGSKVLRQLPEMVCVRGFHHEH